MATLKLRIAGMATAEDERRIETGLRDQPGVLGVSANRQATCAEVEYEDDELSLQRILALVRDLGYEAELAG